MNISLFFSVFYLVHRWQAKAPALFFCLCSFGVFFYFGALINKGEPGCMGVADCSPGTTEAPLLSSSSPLRWLGFHSATMSLLVFKPKLLLAKNWTKI